MEKRMEKECIPITTEIFMWEIIKMESLMGKQQSTSTRDKNLKGNSRTATKTGREQNTLKMEMCSGVTTRTD